MVKAELIDTPVSVGGHLEIDKEDIVAIAVTRAEQHMQAAKEAELKKHEELQKQSALTQEKANEAILEDLKARTKTNAAKFVAAHKLFGIKVETGYSATINMDAKDGKYTYAHYTGSFAFVPEAAKPGDMLKLTSTAAIQDRYKTKPGIVKMYKTAFELQQAAQDAANKAMEWKRRLSNMGQLERQYKARLAERQLSQTAGGQAILDKLTGSIAKDVLALPSK